jgi:hypothetical protein
MKSVISLIVAAMVAVVISGCAPDEAEGALRHHPIRTVLLNKPVRKAIKGCIKRVKGNRHVCRAARIRRS